VHALALTKIHRAGRRGRDGRGVEGSETRAWAASWRSRRSRSSTARGVLSHDSETNNEIFFASRDAAWQRHDSAALAAGHAEDGEVDSPFRGKVKGVTPSRKPIASGLCPSPDAQYATKHLLITGMSGAVYNDDGTRGDFCGSRPLKSRIRDALLILVFLLRMAKSCTKPGLRFHRHPAAARRVQGQARVFDFAAAANNYRGFSRIHTERQSAANS